MLRPTAIKVFSQEDYTLRIIFDNGEEKIFDVKPYIKGNWYGELLFKYQNIEKRDSTIDIEKSDRYKKRGENDLVSHFPTRFFCPEGTGWFAGEAILVR